WVEPDGSVIKEQGPLGLTMLREAVGTGATTGIDGGAGVDLVSAAAIHVTRAMESPRSLRRLRLRVSEVPWLDVLSFPPRQRFDDGRLVIEREEAVSASVGLP